MKQYSIIFGLFALIVSAEAVETLKSESDFVTKWCDEMGGKEEYLLDERSRIDCELENYSVEFDWAEKGDECVGQANRYSYNTGNFGMCMLIFKETLSRPNKVKFFRRTKEASHGTNVEIRCMDFKGEEFPCPID